MEERLVDTDVMFIADHQSPEVRDPGDAPFHLPTPLVPSELPSVLRRRSAAVGLVRADQLDAPPLEPLAQRVGIGGPVVDQPRGLLAGPASSPGDRHAPPTSIRSTSPRAGTPRPVELPEEDLRRLPPPSTSYPCRVWSSRRRHPFFAGAKLPSANVSSQSRRPCSSSSPRNARQTLGQTPCSSQSRSRRRQVLGEGYCPGRSCQRAPERSTHRIPSKHSRFPFGGRPPALERLIFGSSGSILPHCSSVSSESCRDMKRRPSHVAFGHKCAPSANL